MTRTKRTAIAVLATSAFLSTAARAGELKRA